jgi:hypothetical protein
VTNLQYEDQQNKPVPYPEVRRALPGLNSGTPSAISHAGGAGAPRHVPHGVELVPLGVYLIPLGSPRQCAHKAARGHGEHPAGSPSQWRKTSSAALPGRDKPAKEDLAANDTLE